MRIISPGSRTCPDVLTCYGLRFKVLFCFVFLILLHNSDGFQKRLKGIHLIASVNARAGIRKILQN